ncbi:Transglycosylase-associated protein [Leadbetterella byssophila DSM 17132]|uniref:Transglycosylase-associated protein n=1 Tax=Leadbetterella byssophila (strain DSM 17132 / JCM 16389 / KACC 11308 / NBRC 106382 / 4M15) TaxID=649349 RepID=E4RU05_LEAB4|nr:GlsB/YeaQ/YmgE family stress response membrane protein [Leadbetterella byssophila]ADQ18713.1 Transglycosylase-associated protein [Leadbetterella byssophila DSM 17132]
MNGVLYPIIIGAIAGWLAGEIKRGMGFGLIGNIIVGIIGAVVGNWLFGALGVSLGTGVIANIISAVIGALVILFLVSFIKRT